MAGLAARIGLVAAVLALWVASAEARAAAPESEARLQQAARHFADLEDAEARAILDDLSAAGIAEADVLLGYLYADPLYAGRDYEASVAAFERAAAAGDAEGVFQLAEARFWPDYSDWTLSPDEKAARPSAEDAFGLLQRMAAQRHNNSQTHNASLWRLAWLCTFGGYDCGEATTDEAILAGSRILGDNLRTIASAFAIMSIERSGKADSADNIKMRETYLALGYAAADPFVAALQSDPVWAEVSARESCPEAGYIFAAGRLMALKNRTAKRFPGRMDFEDCYDGDQIAEIKKSLGIVLDQAVRTFGNEDGWSQRWCYDNEEWPAIGDCLVTTVHDHFFACTKLSLPAYYQRFGIEYRDSKRYTRCRAVLWESHRSQGRI